MASASSTASAWSLPSCRRHLLDGRQDGKCGDKQVTIERDFYIGVYPVTQEEWQKVMGANPSHFRKGGREPTNSPAFRMPT